MVSRFVGGRWIAKCAYREVDKFIRQNRHLSNEALLVLIKEKLTLLIIRQIHKEILGHDTDYLKIVIERLQFYKENLEKENK